MAGFAFINGIPYMADELPETHEVRMMGQPVDRTKIVWFVPGDAGGSGLLMLQDGVNDQGEPFLMRYSSHITVVETT